MYNFSLINIQAKLMGIQNFLNAKTMIINAFLKTEHLSPSPKHLLNKICNNFSHLPVYPPAPPSHLSLNDRYIILHLGL